MLPDSLGNSHCSSQNIDSHRELDAIATLVANRIISQLSEASSSLLDIDGASERLNVSTRTIEALVALGEIPVVRIGTGRGVRRFDPAALDAFVRRNTRSL